MTNLELIEKVRVFNQMDIYKNREEDGERKWSKHWEDAKKEMVDAAEELRTDVMNGKTPPDYHPELRIVRDKENEDRVLGLGFVVVPASTEHEGCLKFRMIGRDTGGPMHDALLPMKFEFMDVCKIVVVLCGIERSVEINQHFSSGHKTFKVSHGAGTYIFEIDFGCDWPYFENLKFEVAPHEAYGIARAIEESFPKIAFGI